MKLQSTLIPALWKAAPTQKSGYQAILSTTRSIENQMAVAAFREWSEFRDHEFDGMNLGDVGPALTALTDELISSSFAQLFPASDSLADPGSAVPIEATV